MARVWGHDKRLPLPSVEDQQRADCYQQSRRDARHNWQYEDDEYGGLAGGGDYEVYRCVKCGEVKYVELPD
jgi:hypothetical protein